MTLTSLLIAILLLATTLLPPRWYRASAVAVGAIATLFVSLFVAR